MLNDVNRALLLVTEEQKEQIRINSKVLSKNALERDIDSVLEWYKKQQHLPRIELDRMMIERIIISRKGSVEQTKQKIDLMFTLRTLLPELAAPRDIYHADIQKTFKAMVHVPLPKLNHDNTRVNLYKYTKDVDNYELMHMLNCMLMFLEYRLQCDYSLGDRSLIDFADRSLAHLGKEPPSMIKNCELFVRKAYGIRLFGIHVINAPSFVNTILNLVKSVFTEKLASRIFIHEDYDDLYKVIDKDILPVEYGGNERPLAELVEEWKNEFSKDSVRNYLKMQETLKSDESKRIGTKLDPEIMGISGTFRTLEVD